MNALHAVHVVLFAGAGLACLGAVVQTRRLAARGVRRGLVGLLVLSGLWALAVVGQLLALTLRTKEAMYTAGLVAGFGTVFAWLYFVSAYTGRQYHHDSRLVAVAATVYALPVTVKLTNHLHGVYFTARLEPTPFPHMIVSHGAVHWLTAGVAYALSALGFWILYDAFRDRDIPPSLYALVGATALPALPTLLSSTIPGLVEVNYEPIGVAVFAIGALFFAQDSFLELSSPGHSQFVDVLSEGVMLVGENGRVVSYNDNAEDVYPALARGEDALSAIDDDLASLPVGDRCVVTTSVDGQTRHFQTRKEDIAAGPQFLATAITLNDVTRLVNLEEITAVHRRINEAIIEEETESAVKARICEELAAVESYRFAWIGRADDGGVTPRYVAGEPGGYVDGVTTDPDDSRAPVVAATAEREGTPRAVTAVEDGRDDWQRRAAKLGVTACIALSLDPGKDGGDVLGVYTTDEGGFSEPEQATLAEIRETLQHAISAIRTNEEARRFQKAVNQSGYALFVTDTDGTIRYVNPAFEEITGYAASEAIGRTPDLLAGERDSTAAWEAAADGSVWEGDVQNRRKGGERYWARRTVAPVADENGEITAIVAIEVDVTDRRVRQQRLTVLNRVLRHNLRNRMNVIAGNTSLMLDETSDSPDVLEPAERIRDTAAELIELSEKAHTAERLIDSVEHETRRVEFGALLADVESELTAKFPDRSVTVSYPETSGVTVDSALRPALLELAYNGLEHDEGDPHVRIDAAVDDGGDRTAVTVTVADDGPGLPDHEREVLESGDESALKHGSGLGLWLVNWLVVQCGGRLEIDVDGSGTTVTVSVPARTDRPARADDRSIPQ